MTLIHAKHGYDLKVPGAPAPTRVTTADNPPRVAEVPHRIPFIKPRLLVRKGDRVRIGSPLFYDKRFPSVRFRSPGAGTVADIGFGPRRAITRIVIGLDAEEATAPLEGVRLDPGSRPRRETVVKALAEGGLWPVIRALPYRDMAPVDGPEPPAIIVALSNREPFHPHPDVYLDGRAELFRRGLDYLGCLSPKVVVTVDAAAEKTLALLGGAVTHRHRGAYPAGDPGVTVYLTRKSSADNPAWYVRGQDVLRIASLLETGVYPTERLVAVGGPAADRPGYVRTRLGAPLSSLVNLSGRRAARLLAGGLFTGAAAAGEDYLGLLDTAVTLLHEGPDEEFLALVTPGRNRPSYSRAFLSAVSGAAPSVDCNFHGELRACVACSYCNRVCPVEILPQLAFKSLLAEEIEEALAHGLLDCVECGLCSFVCPAKIDICELLVQGKRNYYKEQRR